MSKQAGQLETLVTKIFELNEEWDRLRGKKPSQKLQPPASTAQIAKLQKALDVTLPGDYLGMLGLHNGWKDFHADYSLLSVEEILGPEKIVAELKRLQVDNPKTADHDGIIFLASRFAGSFCVYFDRSTHRADGSMDVVEWDPSGVIERHPSFTAYLESHKGVLEKVIERERKRLRA